MKRSAPTFYLIAVLSSLACGMPAPDAAQAPPRSQLTESFFRGFAWRSVGPQTRGGRIDVEVTGELAHTIFVAAATGGLWRSTNQGVTMCAAVHTAVTQA